MKKILIIDCGRLYWRSENAGIALATGTPFHVGADGDGACRFAGDIDDFALWTRTLSHEDVPKEHRPE